MRVCWTVQNSQSWSFETSASANDSPPTPMLNSGEDDRADEDPGEVQVEAERRHDGHDERGLREHRHDLLERPADEQRGAAQRRDEQPLVRAGVASPA